MQSAIQPRVLGLPGGPKTGGQSKGRRAGCGVMSGPGVNQESMGVFATTRWTVVLRAAETESPGSGEALSEVCRAYWYPLYAYVRRQGFDVHTAQDLTQQFFAKLVEKNYLSATDRQRGRFRWFLLSAFKCFLANEWDRVRALKRGGGQRPLSLEQMTAEERYRAEPVETLSADLIYDRRWALDLLARARQRLEQEYVDGGKAPRYETLKHYLPGGSPTGSQADAGARLGLNENAVKQEVHRMKRRLGELIRDEVAQTVATPEEVDDELRHLTEIVCRG